MLQLDEFFSLVDSLTKEHHVNVDTLVNISNDLDKRISRLEDKS